MYLCMYTCVYIREIFSFVFFLKTFISYFDRICLLLFSMEEGEEEGKRKGGKRKSIFFLFNVFSGKMSTIEQHQIQIDFA